MTLSKKTLAYALAPLLLSAQTCAEVSPSDNNTTSFNFGGTIAPMCKVAGAQNNTAALTLSSNTSQDIGTLEVWCNTGRDATTKYSSANNGYLVDGDNRIAYTLDVGELGQNIDLASDFADTNTQAGQGNDGAGKTQTLKVTPKGTGLESAGSYSDTITVTVAYN